LTPIGWKGIDSDWLFAGAQRTDLDVEYKGLSVTTAQQTLIMISN